MSRPIAGWLAPLLAVACGACGSKSAPRRDAAPAAATETATDAEPAMEIPTLPPAPAGPLSPEDAKARRTTWLAIAGALAARPSAATAAQLDALLAEPAWLQLTGESFTTDGDQLVGVFPAIKALSAAFVRRGQLDESVRVSLFSNQASIAFLRAGREWITSLGEPPAKRVNREHGMATVALGKAINTCGMIYSLALASEPVRTRVIDHLLATESYAHDTIESLQLVLATIDATPVPEPIRDRIAKVHDVIEREHERRKAAAPPDEPVDRYEPLPMWSSFELREVVSRAGGFAIKVGPGALVWSTEKPVYATRLQWQDGQFLVEVMCIPDVPEESLVSRLVEAGAKEQTDKRPGRWLATSAGASQSLVRILAIPRFTCVTGASAPPGAFDAKRADTIVGSFRAAPSAP